LANGAALDLEQIDGDGRTGLVYPYFCQYSAGYNPDLCRQLLVNDFLGGVLEGYFVQQNIPFVNPVPNFRRMAQEGSRSYYIKDGHWTPAGHLAAAKLLRDYIRQK